MNTFAELQREWAERFPHSKLSLIWEEDVKTLLATHRQRMSQLRKELEQEEFLVHYFERCLTSVELKKKSGPEDKSSKLTPTDSQNGGDSHNGHPEVLPPSELDNNSLENDVAKDDVSGLVADDDKPETKDNGDTSEEGKSPYVTVIAVSGFSRSLSAETTNHASANAGKDVKLPTSQSLDRPDIGPAMAKRKKPPTPPPKRMKWPLPSSKSESTEKSSPPSTLNSGSSKPAQDTAHHAVEQAKNTPVAQSTAAPCAFSTFKPPQPPASSANSKQQTPPLVRQLASSHAASQDGSPPSTLAQHPRSVPESNSIPDDIDPFCDDSVIYDTVAADEDHPESKGTSNDDDAEGDYVEFCSSAFTTPDDDRRSREFDPLLDESSSLTRRQSKGSGQTSPSYSTYANLALLRTMESIGGNESDEEEDDGSMMRSMSSDAELDQENGTPQGGVSGSGSTNSAVSSADSKGEPTRASSDEVFEVDSGVYSSSVESTSFLSSATPPAKKKNSQDIKEKLEEMHTCEQERLAMCKRIVSSIIESETAYVECLGVLHQYTKALNSAIGTNQAVLTKEENETIFYKIEQLHEIHSTFRDGLKKNLENWESKQSIGENFKFLASRLEVYKLFLENYSKAIETVRRCSANSPKFEELTKNIKLKTFKGQSTTLEDLLHKPVARVQKNALVLHDLLRYIPNSHPDYNNLKAALKLTQRFLGELNLNSPESMFPHQDRAPRHVVKNSFIIELHEGHRKLRHIFLFNDCVVCAKYKPSTRQKFTFEVKWYIPLSEVTLLDAEGETEPVKEVNPVNVCALRSRASNIRDQILKEEKENEAKGEKGTKGTGRNLDRNRKKLAELEAQLVLHSPNLVFRIGHKNNKSYTFFLSSEFERAQWIEAINVLQSTAPQVVSTPNIYELQSCLTSTRSHLGTNMGTFLNRSAKDEDLLVGDLNIIVHSLQGLNRPTDTYLCFEVDSYGHFFKKAKTKLCQNTAEPNFNQEVVIDLDGSQTLRILCYEEHGNEGPHLRGKAAIELSRTWLTDKYQEKSISLQEFTLNISIKYVSSEMTLQRVPSCKPVGSFGTKIHQVCKKEKSQVPFVITSCVREVERRGINEVGTYRVSGSTSDVQKLKRTFEGNPYEAEQLLKEVDINTVTGVLKLYLRELPEALFTDALYPKFFDAFSKHDQEEKKKMLLNLFNSLPTVNQATTLFLIDHMVRINQHESQNKMSLHNLATVFGPTIIRPGISSSSQNPSDLLTTSTVDVMAQAGILYFFLRRRASGLLLNSDTTD